MKAKVYVTLSNDEHLIEEHIAYLKPGIVSDGTEYRDLLQKLTTSLGRKIQHLEDDFEEVILRDNVYIKEAAIPYLRPGTILRDECFEFTNHIPELKSFFRDRPFGIIFISLWSPDHMEVFVAHADDYFGFAEAFFQEKYYPKREKKLFKF